MSVIACDILEKAQLKDTARKFLGVAYRVQFPCVKDIK